MRCKKHPADLTTTVGVCASCLRERLTALIEAQTRAQAQLQIHQATLSRLHSRSAEEPRKSEPLPPPPLIVFPRSVSPYVSRRKSDDDDYTTCRSDPNHQHHHHSRTQRHHIRFYSTPQVGPTYDTAAASSFNDGSYKKSRGKFSLLTNLFRSRSEKFSTSSTTESPPSWLSSVFRGKHSKQHSSASASDEPAVRVRSRHRRARGMSPDFSHDNAGGFDDVSDRSPSGSGDSTTPDWKRTPVQATPRRARSGPGKNVSGLTFCLSPLVRASPNPNWSNQKGLFPPEMSGEIRVSAKPHFPNAASFCKNRSRKLVDFGRATSNR